LPFDADAATSMTTRLQSEWQRLYLPRTDADADANAEGHVRAMVLTLSAPADWAALSAVWQAVQADLALPAPAIAVNGSDGYQLWFSLDQAVPAHEAQAFLEALRQGHLSHIAPARIGLWTVWPADKAPGQQVQAEQWSAFLAPDLAPMFADTPWLDIPPSPEGQADLLVRLRSIQPAAWQTALTLVQPHAPLPTQPALPLHQAAPASEAASTSCETRSSTQDPRRFLVDVMNDEAAPLALRIEAAKALLPYVGPVDSHR